MITISFLTAAGLVASVLLAWAFAWAWSSRRIADAAADVEEATRIVERYRIERDEAVQKYQVLLRVATKKELSSAVKAPR